MYLVCLDTILSHGCLMNISVEPERLLDPVYLAILANMIEVDCMGSGLACGHWLVLNLIWSHL